MKLKLNKKTIAAVLALISTLVLAVSTFIKDSGLDLPEDGAVETPGVVDAGAPVVGDAGK
jgi:hypothetical protein